MVSCLLNDNLTSFSVGHKITHGLKGSSLVKWCNGRLPIWCHRNGKFSTHEADKTVDNQGMTCGLLFSQMLLT